MAVLIEATSVIIRTEAVSTRVAGGWERFMAAVPTERVCSDDELISVMLIDPPRSPPTRIPLKDLGLAFDWEGEPWMLRSRTRKEG